MCKGKHHKVDNPGKCTPEQIRKCHGDVREHPCKDECQGIKKPKDCTPEQIRKCHGDAKLHDCEETQNE
jgi:hypothetical protein